MAQQKDFTAFLKDIEPSTSTVQYISSVHNNLRTYLKNHKKYSAIHIDTFLSGSYAKSTAIRPVKGDKKRDVDIVVVTSYKKSKSSISVLNELLSVLRESTTYTSASLQHHSIGVEMGQISVDVVPVVRDEYDSELYYIGDSRTGGWTITDPKGHKTWSTSVNQNNSNKYKPLVKIFKWWRRKNCPAGTKYPKGITLEKLIADNLGDSAASTEDFLVETMGNIVSAYKESYVEKGINPYISDPSGKIKNNNLLAGYSTQDFKAFILKLEEHMSLLNQEGTENETWRKILGDNFPLGSKKKSTYNRSLCAYASHRQKMPWPFARGGAAFISAEVRDPNGNLIPYDNNGDSLEKGCSLRFHAYTGVRKPYTIKWQITNTGEEARQAGCLRGTFEDSDIGEDGKKEATAYTGSHSVQCFVIKGRACVAKSQDYIINIK